MFDNSILFNHLAISWFIENILFLSDIYAAPNYSFIVITNNATMTILI